MRFFCEYWNLFFLLIIISKGIEDARKIDKRIQMAWIGHPHFTLLTINFMIFIDNL